MRTRPVSAAQIRAYAGKAQEFADAAIDELAAGRFIAASSLAVHAGINAADAVCGARIGQRAAGEDHGQVLVLLGEAGRDGAEVERELRRLLPLKNDSRIRARRRCAISGHEGSRARDSMRSDRPARRQLPHMNYEPWGRIALQRPSDTRQCRDVLGAITLRWSLCAVAGDGSCRIVRSPLGDVPLSRPSRSVRVLAITGASARPTRGRATHWATRWRRLRLRHRPKRSDYRPTRSDRAIGPRFEPTSAVRGSSFELVAWVPHRRVEKWATRSMH